MISALAGVMGSKFIQTLIDDYINPLMKAENPQFGGLIHALLTMACIYTAGILAT
jgi:ATP-binding cassette subfamily B protein